MKILPKIVLDTNILVSALRSRNGASFALVQAVRNGHAAICCSPALFLEYEDVLLRPKQLEAFGLSASDIDIVLADLASDVWPVTTHYQWRPQLRDPSDEMVLEAAVNTPGAVIVSYNLRDFLPAERFGVKVFNPEQTFRYFSLPKPALKGNQP
jgi:putative PIN family toxin of toxin-antitoxin system